MIITELFPIPVVTYEMPTLDKKQKSWLSDQPTITNVGNRITKNKNLLDEDFMSPVKERIEMFLAEYYRQTISNSNEIKLRITQSWCNYAGRGESHHKHHHPNSILSGVYYVQTNDEDKIYFYNEKLMNSTFSVSTTEYNRYNSETWWIPTDENSLVLFPSDLRHSVESRNTDDPDRISLSFNTFYTGSIGSEDNANFLSLP